MYAGFWWYHGILVVHLQDSVGALGAKWLTKWLHHAKAPPHRGMLWWEWCNKDVHLVTTFVFCHVPKCFYFSTRVSLWKRVGKMPKSGTGHADAIGFRGHIHVMHWNNSSLQLGNKMAKLSNIDSYHETLIHIANYGFACSICAQIIQRILWFVGTNANLVCTTCSVGTFYSKWYNFGSIAVGKFCGVNGNFESCLLSVNGIFIHRYW